MKKFLIFLVSIVVVVCIGLTTYYFLKNDEVISFSNLEVYCNVGDRLYINKDLGYSVTKQNDSTTYNFNAGGEEVTNIIEYDDDNGYYLAKAGGDTTIVITTSNDKYDEFKITVHVGDGSSEATPYYISRVSQLVSIGVAEGYSTSGYYALMNNIALTSSFSPIGGDNGFNGYFDGNGYTITGLNLTGEGTYAGFFSFLNSNAVVTDLKISGAVISGAYDYAGALAGRSLGATITRVQIEDANITNTSTSGVTGGLVGDAGTSTISVSYVTDTTLTVGNADSEATVAVGGFVGILNTGDITATYAITTINSVGTISTSSRIGGFVGSFVIGTTSGSIKQSYAVPSTSTDGLDLALFAGAISGTVDETNANYTKLRYLIGNYAVGDSSTYDIVNAVSINSGSNYFDDIITGSTDWSKSSQGYYLITCVSNLNEFKNATSYAYYGLSSTSTTLWDTNIWSNTTISGLPTLKMTTSNISGVASEYFLRDLTEEEVNTTGNIFTDNKGETLTGKNYKLTSDIYITADDNYVPIQLVNSILDGANYTIYLNVKNNSTVGSTYAGLFSIVDGCTIKNVNIVVQSYTTSANYAGGLAGSIISTNYSSSISNVTVTYTNVTIEGRTFGNVGGLAGSVSNATVTDCKITNFAISSGSANNVGGFVGTATESTINIDSSTGNTVTATLTSVTNATTGSALNIGGFVGTNNNSTITDFAVVANITTGVSANVGGLVGVNSKGTIQNASGVVNLTINGSNSHVGGVAGENYANISAVTLSSGSVTVATTSTEVYLGGVAGTNSADGTISEAYIYLTSLGFESNASATNIANATLTLGGIVADNSGKITQCLVTSNMYGNIVGGVVAVMSNTSSAQVSNVFVGGFDTTSGTISQNTLKADKYVAGIVYDFQANGKITDIQAASLIEGTSNDTICSLMACTFPNGTELSYATVNSTFGTYGKKYLETQYDGSSSDYNIYDDSGLTGTMTNVVINIDAAGSYDYSSEFIFSAIWFFALGNNISYNTNNYHLLVSSSEFAASSTYVGEKSISTNGGYGFFWTSSSITVSIDLGSRSSWASDSVNANTAYSLSFLSNLISTGTEVGD